jgi:hypothetical protein
LTLGEKVQEAEAMLLKCRRCRRWRITGGRD